VEDGTDAPRKVRVALVDDDAAIRRLVRLHLDLDGRFVIVGEAADGFAAVELAASAQPDLLIIDRHMPNLTGVEALPRIREVSPTTAVILYTSDADAGTYQAAIAAGALDVVLKEAPGDELVDSLSEVLVRHWSDAAAHPEVRIGPVPSAAAMAWIGNSRKVVEVVRAHPELLDRAIAPDVFDGFARFLRVWRDVAEGNDEFFWRARANLDQVRALLEAWAAIGRVDDDRLVALGVHRFVPEGRPFFVAVSQAILAAVQEFDASSELAATLTRQWGGRG
jgi:DNA-binding NarL/FixJ family response regulator